jgi:hypothetical protein
MILRLNVEVRFDLDLGPRFGHRLDVHALAERGAAKRPFLVRRRAEILARIQAENWGSFERPDRIARR